MSVTAAALSMGGPPLGGLGGGYLQSPLMVASPRVALGRRVPIVGPPRLVITCGPASYHPERTPSFQPASGSSTLPLAAPHAPAVVGDAWRQISAPATYSSSPGPRARSTTPVPTTPRQLAVAVLGKVGYAHPSPSHGQWQEIDEAFFQARSSTPLQRGVATPCRVRATSSSRTPPASFVAPPVSAAQSTWKAPSAPSTPRTRARMVLQLQEVAAPVAMPSTPLATLRCSIPPVVVLPSTPLSTSRQNTPRGSIRSGSGASGHASKGASDASGVLQGYPAMSISVTATSPTTPIRPPPSPRLFVAPGVPYLENIHRGAHAAAAVAETQNTPATQWRLVNKIEAPVVHTPRMTTPVTAPAPVTGIAAAQGQHAEAEELFREFQNGEQSNTPEREKPLADDASAADLHLKLYDEDWWYQHLEERRRGGAPPDCMVLDH